MTDEELVQTLIGEVLTQYEADSILKSIGNLKSENDELKSRLTHATEECLKWHERAQNLLKDSGGSISGYEKKISDLQAENAALRERLEKAVKDVAERIENALFCEFADDMTFKMASRIEEVIKAELKGEQNG